MARRPASTHGDLVARLDLQKQTRRRRLIRRICIGVLAAAVIGFAIWAIYFSSWLTAREVTITGNTITATEQIDQVAQVPLGQPLARIDTEPIRQRILALPGVADVHIARTWPHTLTIEITERQMVYQRLDHDTYQWVDANGFIFMTSADPAEGITAVTASTQPEDLEAVSTVVLALPESVSTNVSDIEMTSTDRIVIHLLDGRQVMWGSAEKSDEKATVIVPLLAIDGTNYDVSVPSSPAVS